MYTKTITYTDYDGNERTEKFMFNLTKAELLRMDMNAEGGLEKMLRKIVEEQDNKRIFEMFEKIVLSAYGEKSMDGKRFIKSEEASKAFSETEAYSELIMEFFQNVDKAAEFVNGIVPKEFAEAAKNADQISLLPMN